METSVVLRMKFMSSQRRKWSLICFLRASGRPGGMATARLGGSEGGKVYGSIQISRKNVLQLLWSSEH